ncbi:sugar ABC transporter substrate-binding protein [Virgisporangium aliadipatigenens]|uniref:Sugar ABC transporter substrate-binding protein n=1 Tax=Virgisporangium aliadipatigenens TaxID=741659 RepID=A0A8J3YGZ7_9ACTN|nr:extracellular solute-binding protein [Virgisporangium aliadipatigenens]GIJ43865.1 sugar ABC transporter substrate-binding protein [Virgisporangium aliadipatigenens]
MQRPTLLRRGLPLLLASGLVIAGAAACGDSDEDSADGVTTITVNALPPETETVNRKNFLADVAEFEKKYPNIKINAKEGKMDPKTFSTKLAGGQLEDVFYVYFTDPAQLIAKKQTADITPYLKDFPSVQNLKPDIMKVFKDEKGNVYGLPWTNYTLGLLYNRAVFTTAGLDPDKPPTTWADVRTAAKKIADLGDGYVGYGDYSKNNTGGWHFTAELYSIGGDIAVKNGDTWKAAFNNDKGKQVLQQLYDMRWVDNSMGSKQLLEYADLLTMMGSGKLGMYVAAADNIPTIVNQYQGNYNDYGLGPMPGGVNALGGGEAFMFNAKASPAKLKAGITWVTWMYANADRLEFDYARKNADKVPVGLPQPNLFTGADDAKQAEAAKKHGNVPTRNYAPFVAGLDKTPLKLEPPAAQQIYAVLDTTMQGVLTDKNADIGKLLNEAEKQVNQILAAVPK